MITLKRTSQSAHIPWLLSLFLLGVALLVAMPASALPSGGLGDLPLPPTIDPGDPIPPARPAIGSKTVSSLEVRWNGTSKAGLNYRILRTVPGGPAVIVAGTAQAALMTVNDTGLVRDTTYCYVAEVDEPNVGPLRSSQICGYTRAGQTVIRLQIELTTGNVSDANTDNSVFVDIGGRRTWLDHNRDDFERGDTHRYDLTLVGDTADIRSLTLGKTGSNGWCVAGLSLLVNGFSMFQQSFTDRPAGCLWLDNEGGAVLTHHVSLATLRAHPSWASYVAPLPALTPTATGYIGSFSLDATNLRQRIEGMVGDAIHGTALYWPESGMGVEVAPHPTLANAVHVTVHVKGDGFGPNATITIDFDLLFALGQGDTDHAIQGGGPIAVSITDDNFDVRSTGSWDDDGAENDVRNAWPGVDLGFAIDVDAMLQSLVGAIPQLAPYIGRCCDALTVSVDTDARVTLSASLSPRPRWDGIKVVPSIRELITR